MARVPLRDDDPSRVGRYLLTARLGAGGMGVVYLGRAQDGRQVAIKVLRPELTDDPEFRTRFGREVAALMRVRGACTVRVIEADTDAPSPFMVTEYAEGPTLEEYLDAHGPLDSGMLYGLATGLAEALTAIHAAGVVHRDLKPSNVILSQDGPKVIDFGIAHALDATHLTRTGMMVGSAGFMAPEQVTGRAGQAADIFAWAVTIAHASSGRSPFGTGTAHAILYRIVYDDADIAAVPESLRPLVASALAKDPLRRPAARDLLDRLTRASAPSVLLSAPPATAAQAVLAQTWSATEPGAARPRTPVPRTPVPRTPVPRAPEPPTSPDQPEGSLLLEAEAPRRARPRARRRRTALIVAPAVVLAAVAAVVASLMTGNGPYSGQLAGNQLGPGTATTSLPMYPGQQQRGVFQSVARIVSFGRMMVAAGSQLSDGVVRQQFFTSADGGASWRLAPVRGALGYPASLLAGGPAGWLATGPQAIWASRDGLSWSLAAAHGIVPQRAGDAVWVITSTAQGYLAAGPGRGQAVVWTSRDGVTWRRMTAAELGLGGPGETVRNISYAASRGGATVISGQVAGGGVTYSGVWLSTDGGAAWTRVSIPADHGAAGVVSGLAFDAQGMLAVRQGTAASGTAEGVAYFSQNGRDWQYAGTIAPGGGWTPGLVKGSDYGFVVTGTTASGTFVAYTATGNAGAWQPTGPLGDSATESLPGATVAPGGTVVAVGYTTPTKVGQQPVFLEADTTGTVRALPVTSLAGGLVPELAVNGLAASGGQLVAVGSANGYPAIWRKPQGGSWSLVSPLALASAYPRLRALTGVVHGASGWLAVGAPGPVVLTSADGVSWQRAAGGIEQGLTGVAAVAVAAGPLGYSIVGKLVAPGGSCVADVWWSPNLDIWTRAHDVNLATGSSQVLDVAAGGQGFVSAGSHNGQPAVWTTTTGPSWRTIVLPVPAGAASGVLQRIAINGNRVVALGQAYTARGAAMPLAELSVDGGTTWRQVPGPDTAITTLTAGPGGGFTAAGRSGPQIAVWTSARGMTGARAQVAGVSALSEISALAPAGPSHQVTGLGSVVTAQGRQVVTLPLP